MSETETSPVDVGNEVKDDTLMKDEAIDLSDDTEQSKGDASPAVDQSNNQSTNQSTNRSLFSSSSKQPVEQLTSPSPSDTRASPDSTGLSQMSSFSDNTGVSSVYQHRPNQPISETHDPAAGTPQTQERRKRTSVHFSMPPPSSDLLYTPAQAPQAAAVAHLSTKQINSNVWAFFRLVRGIDDFVWCIGCKKYLVYKPLVGISNLRKHIVVKHSNNQVLDPNNQSTNEGASEDEDDIAYQPSSRPTPPYSSNPHHQQQPHMAQKINHPTTPSHSHHHSSTQSGQYDGAAAPWSPDSIPAKNTALLVLDYQKDIVLQFLPNYRAYVDRLNNVISTMRSAGATIVFVHTSFNSWPLTKEISARNMSFVRLQQQKQVRFAGEGADIYTGLNRDVNDIVVKKNRASAFTGSPLSSIIDGNNIRSLVICGLATSGTVLSTILDAADRDYVCTVLKDACWDPQTIAHETLCALVFPTRGTVCTCDEVVQKYQHLQYADDEEQV